MAGLAATVEYGQVDPAVVGAEADAPDDRSDPGRTVVERGALRRRHPDRAIARLLLRGDPLLGDEAVDARLDAFRDLIGLVQAQRQIVIEYERVALHVEQPPVELHAFERALAQVDIASAVTAGDIVVGLVAHALAQGVLVHRQVVIAHQVQPLDHVLAAITPGHARSIANAEMDLAAGEMQVLGDLAAGLSAADNQHRAFGQRLRVAVFGRMGLHDVSGQALRTAGDDRDLIAARGDHHLVGDVEPIGHVEREAVLSVAAQAFDRDPLQQRRVERGNERVDVVDDLIAQHEAVRIGALVREAGQLALPVGCHQAERVPALGAPRVPGPLLLEHHVVDAALSQMPADGQAGLAAADHGDRMASDGSGWTHGEELLSFLESSDRHLRVDPVRERRRGHLDARQLGHRARARPAVFLAYPLARDIERSAAARDEVCERIRDAGREVVLDHQRGRVAGLRPAIGPADAKAHLRHGPAPAAPRNSLDAPARCASSHVPLRPQGRVPRSARGALRRAKRPSLLQSTRDRRGRTRPHRRRRDIR